MRLSRITVLGWITVLAAASLLAQGNAALFDYDASQPTGYKETLLKTQDGIVIYDASYDSPKGGRVPCYVVAPSKKGKYAGIVWQHGGGQDRQWFLPDAIDLARAGAVSILIDSPFNRPKDMAAVFPDDAAGMQRAQLIQVAVDVRRALDVLSALPGVDSERTGYVGLSFGAMMGATLAGFETRFRTYVLDVGLEGFARHYRESPVMADTRARLSKEEFEKLIEAVSPLDARNFVGKATVPLLFQAARFDRGVPEEHTYDFFAMAGSQKKELKWYNSGHMLNDPEAAADRAAWLKKQLKMK